ncbi:TatD family hydrolase [Candidatus Saccharibacteria bacterium]|nr:TatD family hydrolase [Candidatus Saccharibacteria bacterium]
MDFVDTHCHIQFADYPLDADVVLKSANQELVSRVIVVGCTLPDSHAGVEFVSSRPNTWASIGLHPHEATSYVHNHRALQQFRDLVAKNKVVAIGETGLDYHYKHSPKADQIKLLRFQLDLALEQDLPLIFHVRDAFSDFWPIFDNYKGLRGVVHSFTSDIRDLDQILTRGLHIGLNGIMTFTKKEEQLLAAKVVPIDKLLLETDAPFLTPVPFRGTIGEPKYVRVVAEFLANLRGESLEELANATTDNAIRLFKLL